MYGIGMSRLAALLFLCKFGHQISNDIDLFSRQPFNENKLLINLEGIYGFS